MDNYFIANKLQPHLAGRTFPHADPFLGNQYQIAVSDLAGRIFHKTSANDHCSGGDFPSGLPPRWTASGPVRGELFDSARPRDFCLAGCCKLPPSATPPLPALKNETLWHLRLPDSWRAGAAPRHCSWPRGPGHGSESCEGVLTKTSASHGLTRVGIPTRLSPCLQQH